MPDDRPIFEKNADLNNFLNDSISGSVLWPWMNKRF